jgi:arginase
MYDIDKKGIGKVMEEVQDYMAGRSIHLSFDIDSMDPFYAPSTGTAVRGGLTFREVTYASYLPLITLPVPELIG